MVNISLIIVLILLITYPLYFNIRILFFTHAKCMKTHRDYMNNAVGRIATFDKLMVDKMKKIKQTQDNNSGDNIGYA